MIDIRAVKNFLRKAKFHESDNEDDFREMVIFSMTRGIHLLDYSGARTMLYNAEKIADELIRDYQHFTVVFAVR